MPNKLENKQSLSAWKVIVGLALVVAIVGMIATSGNESAKDEAPAVEQTEESAWKVRKSAAYTAAKIFVERRLVSPGSAKFPWFDYNVVVIGEREYQVNGYVDSQNKYGALLRSNYVCQVRDNGDETWSCLKLQIE